ncbi:amino acid adenylation domain-containing protein [Streptomyces sp. NPDC059255]|uniref:non-ribosomal peptide synthetase n=1 Tax=Streptomyces sp. NPDC059255 TaxID=3346793 RepID=UPI0036966748
MTEQRPYGPGALALPADRPRPATRSAARRSLAFELPPADVAALEALATASGTCLHVVLLTGFEAELARWSGQSDFVLQVSPADPCASPTPLLSLTAQVSPTASFRGLLTETLPHAALAPAAAASGTTAPEGPAQVTFTRNEPARRSGDGPSAAHVDTLGQDLALDYTRRGDGGCAFRVHYCADLFERSTVEALTRRFSLLLRSASMQPDVPLHRLPVQEERDEAEAARRGVGAAPTRPPAHVLDRFAEVVEEQPDAVAVVEGKTVLSFAELALRARSVARRLAARGAGPETVVAVCLPRSADLVAAVLGILRTGAAYLPLDPTYPADRLAYMVGDSGTRMLVTRDDLLPGEVCGGDVDVLGLHEDAYDCAYDATDENEWAGPGAPAHPDSCAYVIYTSGSTGRPKGVQVSHRSLAGLLAGLEESGAIRAGAGRVGWNASPSFDASVQQWIRVCRGDTLVLFDDTVRLDPKGLARALLEERLTDFDITPSHLEYVLPHLGSLLGDDSGLRLWVGGETLSPTLQRRIGALAGRLDAVNVYGTTETTVDTTAAFVRGEEAPHLGGTLPGQTLRVLDDWLRHVPVGSTGEIYICGPQVARGYLGRPDLTAENFLPDPWAGDGSRMYRTGDRARWTSDGRLEFQGRADLQVKIRGYRVELGEIEAALAEHPEVLECAVVRRRRGDGSLLDAYLRMTATGTAGQVRERAERLLPQWMRPATYTLLSAMPRTVGGKLDRTALAEGRARSAP